MAIARSCPLVVTFPPALLYAPSPPTPVPWDCCLRSSLGFLGNLGCNRFTLGATLKQWLNTQIGVRSWGNADFQRTLNGREIETSRTVGVVQRVLWAWRNEGRNADIQGGLMQSFQLWDRELVEAAWVRAKLRLENSTETLFSLSTWQGISLAKGKGNALFTRVALTWVGKSLGQQRGNLKTKERFCFSFLFSLHKSHLCTSGTARRMWLLFQSWVSILLLPYHHKLSGSKQHEFIILWFCRSEI